MRADFDFLALRGFTDSLGFIFVDIKAEGDDHSPAPSQENYNPDHDLPPLVHTTERKLMAKIDWHVLPCLCILYLLAFLDR
jgi:hypothetical protein